MKAFVPPTTTSTFWIIGTKIYSNSICHGTVAFGTKVTAPPDKSQTSRNPTQVGAKSMSNVKLAFAFFSKQIKLDEFELD